MCCTRGIKHDRTKQRKIGFAGEFSICITHTHYNWFCWTKKIHDCHVFPIYPTFKLIRKWKIFLADRLHGLDFWNSQNNCTFCNQFQFPRLVCGSVIQEIPVWCWTNVFQFFSPTSFCWKYISYSCSNEQLFQASQVNLSWWESWASKVISPRLFPLYESCC